MLLKTKTTLFIILVISILSCTNYNNKQNHNNFESDTAFINLQLKKILNYDNINNDSVFIMLDALGKKSELINYKKGQAETKYVEGIVNYDFSDYLSAIRSFEKAKKFSLLISDTLLLAKSLEQIASVYLSLGNENLAIKHFYEALPLFEKTKNKEGIAKVYNILGHYKNTQKEYISAEDYYLKAIKINHEINNQLGYIHNKGNLANLYEDIGKTNKAKQIYFELINILKNEESQFNLAVTFLNLALLYKKNNAIDSAIYYSQKALKATEINQDISLKTITYYNQGTFLIHKKDFKSACFYLKKSLDLSIEIGDFESEMNTTKSLMQIDSINNNFKGAFLKSLKIAALNDTLNEIKNKNNLKVSELQYENEKKSNIIYYQNLKLLNSKKEKHFFIILAILTIFILCLLIAFILLNLKNNKKHKELLTNQLKVNTLELENALKKEIISKLEIEKIENKLKLKEKEQLCNAMALEQKTKFLELIKGKFTEALQNGITMNENELNSMLSSLKTQLIESNEIDLFNEKFNNIHSDFYDKLKQSHPTLSKTELKFCAYLKLKLNSNQISSILNVSGEAIRKSRYRIRKKLELSPEASLEDYLNMI